MGSWLCNFFFLCNDNDFFDYSGLPLPHLVSFAGLD